MMRATTTTMRRCGSSGPLCSSQCFVGWRRHRGQACGRTSCVLPYSTLPRLQGMGGASANANINMQLSARTLAMRASQVGAGVLGHLQECCMLMLCLPVRSGSCLTPRLLACWPIHPPPPQDKMAISRKRVWWMLSPLALWFGIMLLVWLLQYYWLASAEERVMGEARCRRQGWEGIRRALLACDQFATLHPPRALLGDAVRPAGCTADWPGEPPPMPAPAPHFRSPERLGAHLRV